MQKSTWIIIAVVGVIVAGAIYGLINISLIESDDQDSQLEETLYDLGKITQQSKIIDINGDGRLDIVVLAEEKNIGYVKFLYQNSDGTFSLSDDEYSI